MSRTNGKTGGPHGVVSPPPSLATNGMRRRSNGNYANNYGRSGYDQQQQQQKVKQPLQPATQEALRRVNSKPVPRNGGGGDGLRQVRSPVYIMDPAASAAASEGSNVNGDGAEDLDVSPLTTPAQSYVPEHRRRGRATSATTGAAMPAVPTSPTTAAVAATTATAPPAPRVAFTGKCSEMNVNKENTNVTVNPGNTQAAGVAAATKAAAAVSAAALVAHRRPAGKALSASSGTPAMLHRRTPSSNGGGGSGGISRAGYAGITTTDAASQGVVPLKRTLSLKARPATTTVGAGTGFRRVASASVVAAAINASTASAVSPTTLSPTSSTLSAERRRDVVAATTTEKQRSPSPDMDWAVRQQVEQAEAVIAYVIEVAQAVAERRRCGPPPDSIETFRASVVPRRRPARRHTAAKSLHTGGPASTSAAENEGVGAYDRCSDDDESVDADAHKSDSVALLSDLHKAASELLSAFTKLEYAQLSEDVDLAALESAVLDRSSLLRRLVDGVDRQLSLHEAQEVRDLLTGHRLAFAEVHELVDFVARTAQQVVLLRGIAAHHELSEAREVMESFKKSVEIQEERRRQQQKCPKQVNGDVRALSLFSPLRVLRASPFFRWLESRWFPAMLAWRQLVLEARQLASGGDTDAAIRRSRQGALQIAGLQEILGPGETITALHHAQVVVPVTELGKTFAQKRAVMDQLRGVMADPGAVNGAALVKALKAAQAYTQVRSGRLSGSRSSEKSSSNNSDGESTSDAELVKQAEELLQRIREVERLRNAVAALLQTPSQELVTLLEHITRANELLCLWRLPHDEASAHVAVAAGRRALEYVRGSWLSPHLPLPQSGRTSHDSSSSFTHTGAAAVINGGEAFSVLPDVPPLNLSSLSGGSSSHHSTPPPAPTSAHVPPTQWIGDGFPVGFTVRALYIPHSTPAAWPAEFGVLYRELCDVFAVLFLQRQAQRQLEQALGQTPAEDRAGVRLSGNTNTSSQHHAPPPAAYTAADFRTPSPRCTQRSSEDGSPVAATVRSSEEGSRCPPSHRDHSNGGATAGPTADELRRRIRQAEEAGISGALIDEARARLRRLLTVRLKIHFDAQMRVLPVADATTITFAEVYEQLHAHCQAQQAQLIPSNNSNNSSSGGTSGSADSVASPWADRRLRIRYEDADGDFISVLNQQDWDAMLSELLPPDHSAGSKVELFCDYPLLPSMSSPKMRSQSPQTTVEERRGSVSGMTDFQAIDGDAEAAAAHITSTAAAAAAPAATPEKQPNVFERLASTKDQTTPNAHGGRGAGGNVNRTPRGCPRPGGSSSPSSPQRALIQRRNRGGAAVGHAIRKTASPYKLRHGADTSKSSPATTGAGQRRNASETPPGKKTNATDVPSSPAPSVELTVDNLRRNIFIVSPSRSSTEGRGAGDDAARASGGQRGDEKHSPAAREGKNDVAAAPSPAAAVPAARVDAEPTVCSAKQQAVKEDADATRGAAAKAARSAGEAPSSVIHLDMDAARRWETASEDDFQLLEIATRASVSTVRMDPCFLSTTTTSSLATAPSALVTAAPTITLRPSASRNAFTTSHCSGNITTNIGHHTSNREVQSTALAVEARAMKAEATAPPPPPTAATPAVAASGRSTAAAAPAVREAGAVQHAFPTDGAAGGSERVTQSPPRHVPRRWTSDDFCLDEIETVCSDRSRMAMLPVIPRGPVSLPPRPQTPTKTPSGTPQRMRRGARGTPTRSRPDDAAGDGGAEGEAAAESVSDMLAEMQRMRDENTRAMTHPRKAVWH